MKKDIINKYNNLFAEASLYYGIPKDDIHEGHCGFNVVYADYLGFYRDIKDANTCQDFITFLKTSYKYFAPFYWFYVIRWFIIA